jgi:two-component system, sensor histidine kinase YesM
LKNAHKSYFTISLHSIRFQLITTGVAILIILWIYFLYNNIYCINVVRTQVSDSNKNLVSLYMQNVDDRLSSVEIYLSGFLSTNSDLITWKNSNDIYKRNSAKFKIYKQITTAIAQYNYINCIFVYSPITEDYLSVYSMSNVTYDIQQKTNDYIKGMIFNNPNISDILSQGYFERIIDGKYYVFRIFCDDDIYIGAWVSADFLQVPLNLINHGVSLFVTADGEPMNNINFVNKNGIDLQRDFSSYYLSGTSRKYLIVGQKSAYSNISLVAIIPDDTILENLVYFRQIALIVSAIFIFIVVGYSMFLKKSVFTPLMHILTVMKNIQKGDINQRITYQSKSDEFSLINSTFNSMIEQIHTLKISIYEEQISKQKEELEHLHLQISPHFFMNSLHIIYSLAQVKNYELVQEMSLCLFKYFSYISRENMYLAKLREEIEHAKNYIRIQELRFPGGFTYEIHAPEELLDVLVPPLMIQELIANTIKHALTMDDPIQINIDIFAAELDADPGIKISFSDTGKWFEDEILKKLRAGKRITDKDGEHIGLWNIQRRLEMIYAGRAKITFENVLPKGIKIDITIPSLT